MNHFIRLFITSLTTALSFAQLVAQKEEHQYLDFLFQGIEALHNKEYADAQYKFNVAESLLEGVEWGKDGVDYWREKVKQSKRRDRIERDLTYKVARNLELIKIWISERKFGKAKAALESSLSELDSLNTPDFKRLRLQVETNLQVVQDSIKLRRKKAEKQSAEAEKLAHYLRLGDSLQSEGKYLAALEQYQNAKDSITIGRKTDALYRIFYLRNTLEKNLFAPKLKKRDKIQNIVVLSLLNVSRGISLRESIHEVLEKHPNFYPDVIDENVDELAREFHKKYFGRLEFCFFLIPRSDGFRIVMENGEKINANYGYFSLNEFEGSGLGLGLNYHLTGRLMLSAYGSWIGSPIRGSGPIDYAKSSQLSIIGRYNLAPEDRNSKWKKRIFLPQVFGGVNSTGVSTNNNNFNTRLLSFSTGLAGRLYLQKMQYFFAELEYKWGTFSKVSEMKIADRGLSLRFGAIMRFRSSRASQD